MLLYWTLCIFVVTCPVRSFDPDLWKYFIPEGLKDPLSRVALEIDRSFDEITAPLRPEIRHLKQELNRVPFVREGIAILDKSLPVLHSLLCVTTKNNFTKFLHFSPHHPHEPYYLAPNNTELLEKSKFDGSLPTKVIIHGFLDYLRISDYWMVKMKNSFLVAGDCNVIVVDWSCGNFFPFSHAIENGKITAQETANLLFFLQDATGLRMKDVHLIGHSLGGQVSAFVGKRVPHLGRISALDPSGPRFYKATDEPHLLPSDAEFVDVIHTNGGFNLIDGMGYPLHTGHVDFFVNGGHSQAGCHTITAKTIEEIGIVKSLWYVPICDHMRAVEYFMESINEAPKPDACHFVGVKCKDWKTFQSGSCGGCEELGSCAYMGYNADKYGIENDISVPNKFYLRTASSMPYCVHEYQVFVEIGLEKNRPVSRPIRLELVSSSAEKSSLTLSNTNRTGETRWSDGSLSFLAVSKVPLKDIEEASVWWGSARKPRTKAEEEPLRQFGLIIKSIRITPIAIPIGKNFARQRERSFMLCGDGSKLLTNGHYLTLSRSKCLENVVPRVRSDSL